MVKKEKQEKKKNQNRRKKSSLNRKHSERKKPKKSSNSKSSENRNKSIDPENKEKNQTINFDSNELKNNNIYNLCENIKNETKENPLNQTTQKIQDEIYSMKNDLKQIKSHLKDIILFRPKILFLKKTIFLSLMICCL